jgi:hypothetical protein
VWEGGFDERPGEPPADYVKLFLQTGAVRQFVFDEKDLNKSMASLSPANPHIFVG